jgi:outer membrane biosynthesis protein TonB
MNLIEAILQMIFRRPSLRPRVALARHAARYFVLVGITLLGAGCEHKSAKVTPAVLVPSIESAPEPEPAPQTATQPETAPVPESTPASTPPAQKPKPKPHKPPRKIVGAPKPEQPKTEPPKAEAAQNEAARPAPPAPDNSVQITAAVPPSAVQSQRQSTETLLRSSKAKLEGVTRPLSEGERAMASQARDYISQSSQAMQEGEIERAYNLAIKASLLADELSK